MMTAGPIPMGNAHAVKPVLPEPFPRNDPFWTCPKTGLKVPKDPTKNLLWRKELYRMAEEDEGFRKAWYTACSQSILYWVNSCVMTFRVKETDEAGKTRQAMDKEIPLVTWEYQDRHILELEKAIDESYDLLTDKTRDMGASWNHIVVFHHKWLFRPHSLFLEMSRVETDVDGSNNPRCLFVKHDFINKWLPEWMRPPGCLPGQKYRTNMHIVNCLNGSRIDGESSNKAAASGDRRTSILLDEFAKVDNAEKIKTSTRAVGVRLVNSTPNGPGTTYSKWRQSGTIKVHSLPWWEHPEKGRGRYVVQDETTGKWQIRSPAYDAEAAVLSPQELAQEWDMDHLGSGDTFFEAHVIEQHKRLFGERSFISRTINLRETLANAEVPKAIQQKRMSDVIVRTGRAKGGPLRIWAPLNDGRLNQNYDYVIGIDISKGQGASNSVASVRCLQTNEIVAEWADASTPPYEFARVVVALALWVGGRKSLPKLIWEANGDPGIDFGRMIVHTLQYPLYYRDKVVNTIADKMSKKYGWHSSREKKALLLGILRRHYAHGGVIHYSVEALDEAMSYVYYEDGGLGPAVLREESAEARKTHGDRTISAALCFAEDTPVTLNDDELKKFNHHSIGGRMRQWKRNQTRDTSFPRSFDFRGATK